jgi:hypothetical protein
MYKPLNNMQKQALKPVLAIMIGILLTTSCTNRTGQEGKRALVPDPETYAHDGYSEQQDSVKPKFIPDTAIGRISLVSSRNVDNFLGENVMDKLVDKGLPASTVISEDLTQRLTYYFHPGGVKKEFSEFQVSYAGPTDRNEFVTDEKEFVTESGIKLGMTMGALRSMKGEPDSISAGEITVLHYRMDDLENSVFLQRYNMPVYYADYEFKDGFLNEFQFGFEYP